MKNLKWLALMLPFLFTASAAAGAEWAAWPADNTPLVIAGIRQDGGSLEVMCDHKYLSVIFSEPRANWQKGQSIDVALGVDDGPNLPPWRAEAMNPSNLGLFDATQQIRVMGQAKTSFRITAAGYTRVIPATNFYGALQPVLQACGESWDHISTGTSTDAFLLLVTWFTTDQPTTNYRVAFTSSKICETARLQVINDAQRVRQEKMDQVLRSGLGQEMAALQGAAAPSVSAICVAQ